MATNNFKQNKSKFNKIKKNITIEFKKMYRCDIKECLNLMNELIRTKVIQY